MMYGEFTLSVYYFEDFIFHTLLVFKCYIINQLKIIKIRIEIPFIDSNCKHE